MLTINTARSAVAPSPAALQEASLGLDAPSSVPSHPHAESDAPRTPLSARRGGLKRPDSTPSKCTPLPPCAVLRSDRAVFLRFAASTASASRRTIHRVSFSESPSVAVVAAPAESPGTWSAVVMASAPR